MIAFFRRTLASKLALGLLALIMLAFVLTGVYSREQPGASSILGESGDTLAKVGDRTLTVPEMDDRVRREYARDAQQQPGLDLPTFVAGGGFGQVVDQVIAATALETFGRSIGLAASEKQVDGQIAGIQAFQGPTGRFDPQVFRAALAQQHIPEASLRRDIAGDTVRQMVMLPATGAISLPDGLVKPYANLLVEQRQGTIGLVPAAAFAGDPPPADVALQAFYKAHVAAYTLPERRALRYALIGRDQVAAAATPSEAEIRKAYDAGADRYAAHETRTLSQVVLDSQTRADAFAAAVRGGKSFADAAKAVGFGASDIAIGDKTQAQFASLTAPAVAAAAFATGAGGVTAPVKSGLGWHVVKVEAIRRVAATAFEIARPQIAGDLAKQKQDQALATMINGAQDTLEKGGSFADVVNADRLAVQTTPALLPSGLSTDDPAYKPSPEIQPLLKPAFLTSTDQPPTVETVQAGERYALLAVDRIVPSAPIPFAQVKPRVAADLAAVRASDRVRAIAAAILAKVKAGMAMDTAFAAAPVPLPPVQKGSGRRMDLVRAQGPVPASLKALFTMPVNAARLVPAEGGRGWYVVQLQAIVPPDPKLLPPLVASSRSDLTQVATDEYIQQFAHSTGDAVGVMRNATAIADLKARLLGKAPAPRR